MIGRSESLRLRRVTPNPYMWFGFHQAQIDSEPETLSEFTRNRSAMIAPWWQDDLKTQAFMAVGEYSFFLSSLLLLDPNIFVNL